MLFVGGAVKLQRASLALHAFFAGLQHIRLYALPGGLGSGADGVADGLNGAGADAVAFGVVNVVGSATTIIAKIAVRLRALARSLSLIPVPNTKQTATLAM